MTRRIETLAQAVEEADRAEREERDARAYLRGRLTKLICEYPALAQAARSTAGLEVQIPRPGTPSILRVCIRERGHVSTLCAVFAVESTTELPASQYQLLLAWLEGEEGEEGEEEEVP